MDKFAAKEVTFLTYKSFWERTNKDNVFLNPLFLDFVCEKVQYWAAFKGEKILCICPIPTDKLGVSILIPFTYYIGPLWLKEYWDLPPFRRYATSQKIYHELITNILKSHQNFHLSFSNQNEDLRAFTWWNYGNKNLPKFNIEPKYTAKINGLQSKNDYELISHFRSDDKRKKIRKLLKSCPLKKVMIKNSSPLIKLYKDTMQRSGGEVKEGEINYLKKIFEFALSGHGEIISLADEKTSEIVAVQLMVDENKTTNAIAQGISSKWYKKGIGILLIYESLISAKKRGIDTFDFNGANSPNRADDKHSYGADYKLFFSISYPR